MMEDLYPKMICRTHPWPNSVDRAFAHANQTIYVQMQGKSEFLVTGNLKDWERWDRLHEIKVKTLTIGARYDEMDPEDMKKMATLMPNASSFICPTAATSACGTTRPFYFQHLINFLHSV